MSHIDFLIFNVDISPPLFVASVSAIAASVGKYLETREKENEQVIWLGSAVINVFFYGV